MTFSQSHNQQEQEQKRKHDSDEDRLFWLLKQGQPTTTTIHSFVHLTKLNLPDCGLSNFPFNLPSLIPNLSILFCPNNHFVELPPVVGKCRNLQMISFKNNGMQRIHPDALQPQLRWLILTENSLVELPETIGRCTTLQKLMLSGNCLKALPESMDQLVNLELVRLACNQLQAPPLKLLKLPNLRWVALSANPFLENDKPDDYNNFDNELTVIDDPILEDTNWPILGQGAGGITRQVLWDEKYLAVKTFSGELTSDGSPQDERAISVAASALMDPSLIHLFGQTSTNGSLVMEFLQGYEALAGPPNLETCSRDVYSKDQIQKIVQQSSCSSSSGEGFAWSIAMNMLRVLQRLHEKGICHGDFYGHNILISSSSSSSSRVKLSDFGAAFFYKTDANYGCLIQKIELRAYGVLVEELQMIVSSTVSSTALRWDDLVKACNDPDSSFTTVLQEFYREDS